MNLFDLTGRTAIITGGNGGLGLAMDRGLAKAGANVAIWARNADKNAAAVEELRGLGAGDVLALTCDVAEEAGIAAALEQTLDPQMLTRVHRSAFVNLARVQEVQRLGKGLVSLVVRDGVSVAVGPTYVRAILSRLGVNQG